MTNECMTQRAPTDPKTTLDTGKLKVSHVCSSALRTLHFGMAPRYQIVVVEDEKAEPHLLQYGVPQGSVLGPSVYSMYTMPLGRILKATGLEHHSCVDDTQTYNTFVPCPTSDKSEGIKAVERGLELARSWFERNMLKLNNEKTEVIAITSTRASVSVFITLGDCVIESKPCVRDLAVNIDNTLFMEPKVNCVDVPPTIQGI